MTNDCPRIQPDLKAYADRELPWPRRLVVCRHLAQCDACRKELTAMTQISEELRAAEVTDTALDPALRAKLLADIPSSPTSPESGAEGRRFRLDTVWKVAGVGAIVLALVAVLLLSFRQAVPQRVAGKQIGLDALQYTQDNDEIESLRPTRSGPAYPLAFPLDVRSQAILSHADRVETFRLADFHDGETYTQAEWNAAYTHPKVIGEYTIAQQGRSQSAGFAHRLSAALAAAGKPNFYSCFDPGVGFRAWKGRASVSIFVCFYCSGVQAVTRDATGKEVETRWASLGQARATLLALSKEAFPNDKRLARLR